MTTGYVNCCAHGCPMQGTSTRSTTGVKEDGAGWLCFLHFAAAARRWDEITMELNRFGWLVAITRDMRAVGDKNEVAHHRDILANKSSHLLRGDHESAIAWLVRLETALQQACNSTAPETAPLFDVQPGE